MSVKIVPKDILHSAKLFKGDIFEWDYKNASDNITNHKAKGVSGKYDATWVPLYFKKADDKGNVNKVQINALEIQNVLNSSKPTKPSTEGNDNNKIKNLLMVFKRVTPEEVRTGDYLPKIKNTPEEQELANKKAEETVHMLCNNTNELADILDAIDEGFSKLCEKIKEEFIQNPNQFKFNMAKDKNWVISDKSGNIKMFNPSIRSIKQINRKDENNPNKSIPLDTPIYRLKLPVYENKMVLSWRNKTGGQETKEYIYDARKSTFDRNNTPILVPAKIKTASGISQSLTVDNVDKFVTNRSAVSLRLKLPKLVISKQGFSLVNEITQLVVKRHKTKSVVQDSCIDSNSLLAIKGEDSDDDDVIEELTELKVDETKKLSDGNITDSSEDMEIEQTKPIIKKPSVQTRKPPTKKFIKKTIDSDDDLDD
jgi:hypothetical protein